MLNASGFEHRLQAMLNLSFINIFGFISFLFIFNALYSIRTEEEKIHKLSYGISDLDLKKHEHVLKLL